MWKLVFHQCTRYLSPLTAFLRSCHSFCWYLNDAGSLTEVSAANWSKLSRLWGAFKWLVDTLALHCTRVQRELTLVPNRLSIAFIISQFYDRQLDSKWDKTRLSALLSTLCAVLRGTDARIPFLLASTGYTINTHWPECIIGQFGGWQFNWLSERRRPRGVLYCIYYIPCIYICISVGIYAHLCISQMPSSY